MTTKRLLALLLFPFATLSCTDKHSTQNLLKEGRIERITIAGEPSLRGVDVLNDTVAWVSGSKGTFARTVNGGKRWEFGTINNDTLVDFRDIRAFGSKMAVALSAGSPAKIYRTSNGGQSWQLIYFNPHPSVFFNSFDFCDSLRGIACSDPIDGKFFFIKTMDGGETWDTISPLALPTPLPHEAGFAASGTSVHFAANGVVLYGTGGDKARIIRSADYGETWEAIETPIKANDPSLGIYSIGCIEKHTYIATGGNWQQPSENEANTAATYDGGKTWSLTQSMPSGFMSVAGYMPKSKLLVVSGTNGTDISNDMGRTWLKTSIEGYNALDVSACEQFTVFVGSGGRIGWVKR